MSLWSLLGGLGSIYGGIETADKLYQQGESIASDTQAMADQAKLDTAFKGYGVTTGLGSGSVDAQGNTNIGVGPNQAMQGLAGQLGGMSGDAFAQAMAAAQAGATNPWANQAQGMMGAGYDRMAGANNALAGQSTNMMNDGYAQMANAFANIPGREQEIYGRAMAMQQPGLDAQRASQQAREFAQGRGGIRGSQFGGTAEDAATARAQAQAQNQASFQAMNQAQSEAMNQLNAGQARFGAGGQMNQQGLANAQFNMNAGNQMFGAGSGYNQAGIGNAQLGLTAGAQLGQLGGSMATAGQNYYGQSFLPMDKQLAAMQVGGQNADRFQSGQFTGANLGTQLDLGGLQVLSNMYKSGTELEGNMYASAANAIGGVTGGLLGGNMFTDADGNGETWQKILDSIL